MKYRIISVYRKTHDRYLTAEERNLAKSVGLACGSHSQIILNDIESVPVHVKEIEALDGLKAMKLYHEDYAGAEILFCENLEEVR